MLPEITISSVSEASPYNSTDCNSGDAAITDDESASDSSDVPPIEDKSGCDSSSDSTDGDSRSNGAEQEHSRKLRGWIQKAKGWYSPKKLEEFYPLTEEDAALLRRKTGRNYELSYVNKLLIKHSMDSPNNRFPCKEAVLNYMKKTLIHEMRPPSVANNPLFNFKLDNATKAIEAYLQKVEASKGC